MNKILLIGNSGFKHQSKDGQTTKVRLYLKKLKDEGMNIRFVDLEGFITRPFSSLLKIKKDMKWCDRVVLISAERGCKILIPYINRLNKKMNKPFVLPLVGTNVLHQAFDKLDETQQYDFIANGNYKLSKFDNRKFKKELSKITYILPETDLLSKVFREYFELTNVVTLNNFRECREIDYQLENHENIRIVYLSRVMSKKGIFDLLECVKKINTNSTSLKLDIYGGLTLSDVEKKTFASFLDENIRYCGLVDEESVINTISKYDFFVFPTQFVYEGTPGAVVESFLAGVPVISSNFPQAKSLMNDGVDSLVFKMFDKKDLYDKLLYIINNKEVIVKMKNAAKENGKRFTYNHERKLFMNYVCGVEE